MKKVLIALDYSDAAEKVAKAGYAIAKLMQAEITMAHVITEPHFYDAEHLPFRGYYHGGVTGVSSIARDIKKHAQDFLLASVQHLGDNNIKTKVLEGETAHSLLKYSEELNADLIVMGSHRHHGLDKLLLTHVTRHVITQSQIPQLIIPTGDKYHEPQ